MALTRREVVWVHCHRDGVLLKSYDFGWPESQNPAADVRPSRQSFENGARSNLSMQRLAFPPYDGITFEVEYPR
jgi:hypothetical protein